MLNRKAALEMKTFLAACIAPYVFQPQQVAIKRDTQNKMDELIELVGFVYWNANTVNTRQPGRPRPPGRAGEASRGF